LASSINASTTAGVVTTADTSGVLNLQTAGTTAIAIDASQNVGIGTVTPSFPSGTGLAIFNTSAPRLKFTNSTTGDTSTDGTQLLVSGSDFYIQQREAASVFISTNGTNAVTVDSGGGFKVLNTIGVGNATPSTSGAGITFPATQSASTDANTLDDYEEGTFTPSLSFGDGVVGLTYNYRVGIYVKVGNVVSVFIRIALTDKGSSTGHAGVSGLPFTASGTTDAYQVAYVGLIADMSGLTSNPFGQISPNTSNFYFYQTTSSNYATLTQTNFLSSSTLNIQFTYLV